MKRTIVVRMTAAERRDIVAALKSAASKWRGAAYFRGLNALPSIYTPDKEHYVQDALNKAEAIGKLVALVSAGTRE